MQVFACGRYKTAAERFDSEQMSDAQREQTLEILQAVDASIRQAVARRFEHNPGAVDLLFQNTPCLGEAALNEKYVDVLCAKDELKEKLGLEGKGVFASRAERLLRYRKRTLWRPLLNKPAVAVIEIHGMIVAEQGQLMAKAVCEKSMLKAIAKAKKDKKLLGVLLDINSPGGSAEVSETVYRAIRKLSEEKPVVAYFSDVAASGGYFIGVAASSIVARPLAITGSIGVISMKPVLDRVLQGLGVKVERVEVSPHSTMFSPWRRLQHSEADIIRREADVFYQRFIDVVAKGRALSNEQVQEYAQGRVWTGEAAHRRGLVDELGGVATALDCLAKAIPGCGSGRELQTRTITVRKRQSVPAWLGASVGLLGRYGSDVGDLLNLCLSREKVFYYEPNLPTE
ncbi:MAG: signal peptide peptidase SppA [Myxococcales bacterium]|nr:MAG: signal peptide peptidase SppA [Myxococcales bacterium]